ncbi:transcriptional regulator Kaiso isoform X1 [Hemicordylus capensis]|nr:transcriptional regulator Kaiso isoform X1 [Hemicordylus capensis]XP_053129978.1 transcriptional regulator Kaiso isoform X1 [Hemicordylus capensis]XP_053129979.1 transcriptional regulator Kaiso isoform X1 [Hemicordylus capensis]XP_053129981.1 transcriptional regulator Kaiso isoform X1 [Hemicordylus capensis]XP_053129982.1 transcriptional regulator Kaiso isoform X1 [Hemicordylus capensis]
METRKLITATDNQYSGMLLKALDEQRCHGLFCDVTVIVEDRKFRAHRNVLSASSTYFHQLFSVAGQVVELSFIRAEIFAEILNYIYSSKIVRVRSDLLDELIKSGQLLGVKFLADLGAPLQQVKSMSGGVKPGTSEQSSLDTNSLEAQRPLAQTGSQNLITGKPVITESFSLYGEECDTTKITISDSDDDDDDVIFCSELVPPKDRPLETKAVTQNQPCPNPADVSSQTNCPTSISSPPRSAVATAPRLDSSTTQSNPTENQAPAEPLPPSAPKPTAPNVLVLNPSQISASPDVGSSHEIEVSPIPEESQQPSNNDSLTDMETNAIDEEEEEEEDVEDDDDILGSSSPGSASSSSLVQQPTTPKPAAADNAGGQKKQVAGFPQEPAAPQPGEFKIKISDVLSGSNKDSPAGVAPPKHVTEGQKTITLDTATEIEGLSTGCKVYANIGEDTYDIVIPVKDEADGEVRLDDLPRTSGDDPANRKRLKVKHDDHYELIMDGKVYYICIVCRRSYVCLTSLRRHFNVHSWEKKYPCRYCEKVFPLAEYRTKHEIHHTGERRYQCLACGQCFINYQVMATHIRSVHSQDPSGESKLYRLHPCRSLQIRNYAYISGGSSNIPMVNDNALVYPVGPVKDAPQEPAPNPPVKSMTWDDIFVPQANESLFKQNPSDGSTEFEFVIPESY